MIDITYLLIFVGLKDVLGLTNQKNDSNSTNNLSEYNSTTTDLQTSQGIEAAMANFEDEEDISALKLSKKEAVLENGINIFIKHIFFITFKVYLHMF